MKSSLASISIKSRRILLPEIKTLIEDIYGVFTKDVTVPPGAAKAFGEELSRVVIESVQQRKGNYLRLSNLGNSCRRQLWYSVNTPELAERMSGATRIKFLIGNITESVVLFLAKLSGHVVTDEQKEVSVHGVKGHIDAKIDGHLVDVKSTSPSSFIKFKDHLSSDNDAFGYLSQLGTYAHAEGESSGSFLAVEKVLGHLHLDTHELPEVDYEPIVRDVQAVLSANEPPPRAFEDEKFQESGNRKLGVKCSYCDFKTSCWPGVQRFDYARSSVFLTKVVRPPTRRTKE